MTQNIFKSIGRGEKSIEDALLVGSTVRGDYEESSDLDTVLVFKGSVSYSGQKRLVHRINREIVSRGYQKYSFKVFDESEIRKAGHYDAIRIKELNNRNISYYFGRKKNCG